MSRPNVTIAVEAQEDLGIVEKILVAAGLFSKGRIKVIAAGGKSGVAAWCKTVTNNEENKYLALVDADVLSVSDSRAIAREQLGNPSIEVFCAVPTIEAWLFADDATAEKFARSAHAAQLISRAPLPEMIPYPKQLAFNVFDRQIYGESFRGARSYPFLELIDVKMAMARSPSLKAFLLGVAKAVGVEIDTPDTTLGRSIPREIFSNLLRELPSDTVVWKTVNRGSISAEELAAAIVEGDSLGKQYITEVLRVARDIIGGRSSPE